MTETRVSAMRGASLTIAGSVSRLLIQFTSVVVLSRLLEPSDFGLIAMVTVFVAFADLIRDFGMPTAALQAKELSRQQSSNLFWVSTALGLATGLVLVAATPLISGIYSEPRLAQVVPVMAFVVLMNGMQAQLQVQLARSFRFAGLATTEVAAQLAGLAAGVSAAMLGWGYWALVLQAVATYGLLLGSRWILLRWIPSRPRRGHGLRAFVRSGAEYGGAYFLTYLASNVDTLIVGANFGASAAGHYNRAYQMLTLPMGRLLTPLTQVVVPTLNRMTVAGQNIGAAILRAQFAVGLGVIWIFAVSAGLADTLVPFLLGSGWTKVIPIFQMLAIGGCFWVLSYVSYWVFIVTERSRELLRYNLVSKPIVVVLIILGSQFGAIGVAAGYAAGMALSWPINLLWMRGFIELPTWRLATNGGALLAAGALAFIASGTAQHLTSGEHPLVRIAVGVVSGTVAILAFLSLTKSGRSNLLWVGRSILGMAGSR